MNKFVGSGLVLTGILATYMFYSNNKSRDPAEKLVLSEFKKMIQLDKNITLEKAILNFEFAEEANLDEFAKKKGRSKECYISTYKEFFLEAQNNL